LSPCFFPATQSFIATLHKQAPQAIVIRLNGIGIVVPGATACKPAIKSVAE
jgi:hypothetical protein